MGLLIHFKDSAEESGRGKKTAWILLHVDVLKRIAKVSFVLCCWLIYIKPFMHYIIRIKNYFSPSSVADMKSECTMETNCQVSKASWNFGGRQVKYLGNFLPGLVQN